MHIRSLVPSLGLVPFLCGLLSIGGLYAQAGTLSVVGLDRWVTVAYVFDGDTFRAANGEKVRLLGINAPEVAHKDEPGEPFGKEAARMLARMIDGQVVRLKLDRRQRDDYGRLLAHVYRRDGAWINGELVRRGLAFVYTFEPNTRWTAKLLALERQARSKGLGIWQSERFRILAAAEVANAHIGQFRLVRGRVTRTKRNGYDFTLDRRLHVSVPRKYRMWFKQAPRLRLGQQVLVRGVVRASRRGRLYLALHSPFDVEIMQP